MCWPILGLALAPLALLNELDVSLALIPRGRAAEERDELAPFPLTEMHPILTGRSASQDIGLRRISRWVPEDLQPVNRPRDRPNIRVGSKLPVPLCLHLVR